MCVCAGDNQQPNSQTSVCQSPPPAIRTCLTPPFFNDTHISNSMTSQKDVNENNKLPGESVWRACLPFSGVLPALLFVPCAAKGKFTTANYGNTGLVIGATAFTDGLETAEFTWLNTALLPACSAKFTQNFANIASSTWSPLNPTTLIGVATPQQGHAPYNAWADLPMIDFTLTLDSQMLNECGFSTVEDNAEHFVTYENTLCGDFKYKEWYVITGTHTWHSLQASREGRTSQPMIVTLIHL
jgi:hypothetical protein